MRRLEARLRELAREGIIVTAHRGDPVAFGENTLAAYRHAADLGVGMIEFDVRETWDGEFVCIHDATFDRTTDSVERWGRSHARVDETTLGAARQLDAGSGERVPELGDALASMRPAIPMIEHKAGRARSLVDLLREHELVDSVLVQSFDWDWLREVRALEPFLTLGVLGGDDARPTFRPEFGGEIRAIDATLVHWQFDRITRKDVAWMHGHDLLVCVFTADQPADYDQLIEIGVDAITTNYPARLLSHLRQES